MQFQNQPILSPKFDDKQWVIQIHQNLNEEIQKEENEITPVTIFTVPKILKEIDPNSYIPHQIAIGPYHYTRSELHEMDRYKIDAARRNLKKKPGRDLNLQVFVDHLIEHEPLIRAHYNKFLSFSSETLLCMMAMDAVFLFEFLRICASKQGKNYKPSQYNAILRDISMLENQIPLVVIRKLLELEFSSIEKADEILVVFLYAFCADIIPFKIRKDILIDKNKINVKKRAHLLDVLYHSIVQDSEEKEIDEEVEIKSDSDKDCSSRKGFIRKGFILSDKAKRMLKVKGLILSSMLFHRVFKLPIDNFLDEKKQEDIEKTSPISKCPLLEEIEIPSVMQLVHAGVRFNATQGGIETLAFDNKTMTLHLPTMILDVNSEVVLRNMVAYEACSVSGALVLARYIELMNGIIDTKEDARFLRKIGIVVNHLKSDQEVANLWNGMTKSIRLTKVGFLDKVIQDVNKYYYSTWRVRVYRCVKRYVVESWKLVTFVAALLMIAFMGLQAFCSLHSCTRHIRDLLNQND